MLLNEHGDYVSEDEEGEEEEKGPIFDEEEEMHVTAAERECFVVKRTLISSETPPLPSHRETIFHTCCHIEGKVCSVIIDGGSCCNIVE